MSPGASDEERLRLVVRALAASILACLAFSGKLWLSARLYPLVPVLGVVPPFPWPLDLFVLALLVGLLVGLVARPLSWPLAAAVVGLFALLFAQDQSRLWPSFYQFFLLLLLLLAHRPGGGEPAAARTLHGMRFVLAAVYFWGGVQKLTPHFFREEFPWFVRPLTDLLPGPVPWLPVLGLGIGLLTRRFRRIALGEALLMHAVILVCIGPLRGDWNDSAWIWSLATAGLAWLLFRAAEPFRLATMFAASRAANVAPAVVVVLAGILPVLDNFNRWDSALSFNVYTGNTRVGHVVMPPGSAARLPREIAAHALSVGEMEVLDLNAWAMQEFNAGTYPADRVFRALLADICGRLGEPTVELVVVEKASWLAPKTPRRETCCEP
jgi:hypothetical protein